MGNAYRVRLLIPNLSTVVDTASINFPFEDITPGGTSGGLTLLASGAVSFINGTAAGQGNPIAYYLGNTIDRVAGHAILNIYNITGHLDGSLAGAPVYHQTWTVGPQAAVSNPVPEGMACALSWRADYGLDPEFGPISDIPTPPDIVADYGAAPTHKGRTRPRQRDRNRTFIGPLGGQSLAVEASTGRCIFTTQFQSDLLRALFAFADLTSGGVPQFALRAWSRRNASLKIVTLGYVDDRPDYQRRRADPSAIRMQLPMPSV